MILMNALVFTLMGASQLTPGFAAVDSLSTLLDDQPNLLKSSELSIVFPGEKQPAVRRISIKAENQIAQASIVSEKEIHVQLDATEYANFLSQFRSIRENELRTTDAQCRNQIQFEVRVRDQKRSFSECRGAGLNASILSRIARDAQFLVMKRLR